MNQKKIILPLIMIIVGVILGVQIHNQPIRKLENSFLDKEYSEQAKKLKMDNLFISKKIDILKSEIKAFEKNSKNNKSTVMLSNTSDKLKFLLAYTDVSGEGIIINIDTNQDMNLGSLMEEKKWFLLLVNELKQFGAEAISINNQRIGPFSEITYAGSHLNINSTPIVHPFEVKIVGDSKRLSKNFDFENTLLDTIKENYNVKINVKQIPYLTVPKLETSKKITFLKN